MDPAVEGNGPAQGQAKRLENGLSLVVVVSTITYIHVQGYFSVIGEGLEEVGKNIGIKVFDLAIEIRIENQIRPAGYVEVNRTEGLVHRNGCRAVTVYAFFICESFLQRVSQTYPDILDQVMIIDAGIAAALHIQIDQSVPGKKREHVVQERD